MNQRDIVLKTKRGTDLHTTVVLANDTSSQKGLIMVHGFKADRTEGGRFIELAHNLAVHGISCICMSFPGCGDSTEDFFNYTLENNLSDIDVCVDYMIENANVDVNNLGMVGYSMGGRLTCLYAGRHPELKSVALWAAASDNYTEDNMFMDERLGDSIDDSRETGLHIGFNTFDKTNLNFNHEFLTQMIDLKPFDAITSYKGNVLIIHGDKDITVPPEASVNSYNHLTTDKYHELMIIEGANHGFGLWTDEMEQSARLVSKTTEYFLNTL